MGGMSVRAFARKTGVSDTFLRQCLAGRTDPTRAKLIAIAEAGNTSLQWLATGAHPAAAAVQSGPDIDRLHAIIETVEAVVAEQSYALLPSQKAHLITALYQRASEPVTRETVVGALDKVSA
ncbi:MAG: hypothetical protein BRD57_05865 [Proteobacteria bacterium SW_6_67_9]|nr:MAG: hypothetical protein BRD57_05865 [Proteobacteria bacterium SW_6_67_9]